MRLQLSRYLMSICNRIYNLTHCGGSHTSASHSLLCCSPAGGSSRSARQVQGEEGARAATHARHTHTHTRDRFSIFSPHKERTKCGNVPQPYPQSGQVDLVQTPSRGVTRHDAGRTQRQAALGCPDILRRPLLSRLCGPLCCPRAPSLTLMAQLSYTRITASSPLGRQRDEPRDGSAQLARKRRRERHGHHRPLRLHVCGV